MICVSYTTWIIESVAGIVIGLVLCCNVGAYFDRRRS